MKREYAVVKIRRLYKDRVLVEENRIKLIQNSSLSSARRKSCSRLSTMPVVPTVGTRAKSGRAVTVSLFWFDGSGKLKREV